ncbi:MAG: cysteine desulfurase [Flavobacteriales bacterium]|nr:cysteine desulfurase [Flavobacteriales bacterium]MBT7655496.1 cysteine desulfurase [Flavobacteriales bacterium]MDG1272758.1 cysteine desulfurase family protein [Flavobacteriaceae bacterium]
MMDVYFDNAATTPMRPEVIEAISESMQSCFGNPSSTHGFGRTAKSNIESARKSIAGLLGAQAQEIIFTSGGTESDNMILRCAVKDLGVKTIISSKIEHHAVLHTLDALEASGIQINYVKLTPVGSIDLKDLEKLLKESQGPVLVSLMHVNNEIGTILDIDHVAHLCEANQAYFHTDAVQGVGHFELDLSKTPIHFLSSAAHKYHGPKGIGFSYVRKNSGLDCFIYGGAQEKGLRAGTEAVHSIVGMQKAIELSYAKLAEERQFIQSLKLQFIEGLREIFPQVHFNGCCSDFEKSTYTLVNVALPIEKEQSMLLDFQLDLKGIACSKGSACQSGSGKGSHVLSALETTPQEMASLRFSFSSFNTSEEVAYVLDTLKTFTLEKTL